MDGVIGNYPYWHARTLAGIIFTAGMLCFVWNVLKTIQKGKALEAERATRTPVTAAA
jgi:cytochrome c oxidase cbb3-type subunit I